MDAIIPDWIIIAIFILKINANLSWFEIDWLYIRVYSEKINTWMKLSLWQDTIVDIS